MATRTFRVHRFDSESDDKPSFEIYDVPVGDSTSVLDGLFHIQEERHVNLSFRFSCRQGVCGSCCMEVNGRAVLACQTPILTLDSDLVTIRPLYNLPIIKDLVVDMEPFFDSYRAIDPSFESDTYDETDEPAVVPPNSDERRIIEPRTDCVGCGACYSMCSVAGGAYLGPAAINKALTLIADSRDTKTRERLDRLASADGVWGCHTQGSCSRVCPKGIPVSEGIQYLKREVVKQGIKDTILPSLRP